MPDLRAFAWSCLTTDALPQVVAQEYRQHALGAYALVAQLGLLQAIAYWQSQAAANSPGKQTASEKAAKRLALDVCEAVRAIGAPGETGVLDALRSSDATSYRVATVRALDFLRWLRLFAAAHQGGQP